MHTVAVLALHGVIPLDLGIACDAFATAPGPDGRPFYRVKVCGEEPAVAAVGFRIEAPWGLRSLSSADTVIVPGIMDVGREIPEPVLRAIRAAWKRGARVASICSGAFVLAATGLLEGRRATTHWLAAERLAREYPGIRVDANVLFVDEGRIITSAGAAAGMDMCLHLIGRDCGQAVAAAAARLAVVPLHRDGGQAQFIRQTPPASAASLAPLLTWMLENLHKPLDVDALAKRACVSPRTFARRFREQTGTTPIQWLLTARVRRAQELLERQGGRIDQVATAAGFDSPVTFRARFRQVTGISPAAYQRRFSAAKESPKPARTKVSAA